MLTRTFPKFAFACAILSIFGLIQSAAHAATAYDLTAYRTMAKQVLELVAAGNMGEAKKKVGELEGKWDSNNLRESLPQLDEQMDAVKDAVNSGDAKKATAELNRYLEMIDKAPKSASVSKPTAAWAAADILVRLECGAMDSAKA